MPNNEDYLNNLITKAKKSWEGVDVDNYMKNLRGDSFDKEVVENLSKEVASYITEQIKSNMDKVIIKCRDLMVGDWITNRNGFPMQITNVGKDYAYATWEGNEGDPWEFDDKDCPPSPIEITKDILEKNAWKDKPSMLSSWGSVQTYFLVKGEVCKHIEFNDDTRTIWLNYENDNDGVYVDILVPCKYVHQLQQVLRLAGMTDMANNFKI